MNASKDGAIMQEVKQDGVDVMYGGDLCVKRLSSAHVKVYLSLISRCLGIMKVVCNSIHRSRFNSRATSINIFDLSTAHHVIRLLDAIQHVMRLMTRIAHSTMLAWCDITVNQFIITRSGLLGRAEKHKTRSTIFRYGCHNST